MEKGRASALPIFLRVVGVSLRKIVLTLEMRGRRILASLKALAGFSEGSL